MTHDELDYFILGAFNLSILIGCERCSSIESCTGYCIHIRRSSDRFIAIPYILVQFVGAQSVDASFAYLHVCLPESLGCT